jgi:hypothetical protein
VPSYYNFLRNTPGCGCCGPQPLRKCCQGTTEFPALMYATLTVHKVWAWVREPWSSGTGPWIQHDIGIDRWCGNCEGAAGSPMPIVDIPMVNTGLGGFAIAYGPEPGFTNFPCNTFDIIAFCDPGDARRTSLHASLPSSAFGAPPINTMSYQFGWPSEYAWLVPQPGNAFPLIDFTPPLAWTTGEILSCDPLHLTFKLNAQLHSGSTHACPDPSVFGTGSGAYSYTDSEAVTVSYGLTSHVEILLEMVE